MVPLPTRLRSYAPTLLIFLQSLLAMLGSLYFSHFGDPVFNLTWGTGLFPAESGFPPCELCYIARILMYPIVGISAVGWYLKDKNVYYYVLALAVPGVFLELYHYFLQKVAVGGSAFCTLDNPCDAMSVNYWGFVTIPFLCLVAFSAIVVFAVVGLKKRSRQ